MRKKPIDERPAEVGAADHFLSTLSLVCRIPLPFRYSFSARRMDLWLPVTALFQSLLFFLGFAAFGLLFRDKNLGVLAALIFQYGAFNLFHFDGLLDTADAFLGAFDREKRFQILKDPRLGVYGIFTAVAYLAFKLMVLQALFSIGSGSTMGPTLLSSLFFLILLFPLAGKTAAALIPGIFPPAKPEGLGALAAGSKVFFTLLGFFIALALYGLYPLFLLFINMAGLGTSGYTGPVGLAEPWLLYFCIAVPLVLVSALLAGFLLGRLYRKGLGGYTGDTLGAAVELGELVYLLGLLFLCQRGLL